MIVTECRGFGQESGGAAILRKLGREEARVGGGVLPALIRGVTEILPLERESSKHGFGTLGIIRSLFFQLFQLL